MAKTKREPCEVVSVNLPCRDVKRLVTFADRENMNLSAAVRTAVKVLLDGPHALSNHKTDKALK